MLTYFAHALKVPYTNLKIDYYLLWHGGGGGGGGGRQLAGTIDTKN